MTTLWQDMLYGFRTLLKKPGFTIVAALSLGLGIGANTIIFTLIDTTLLRPLPYPDAGRLVMIWSIPLDHPDQLNSVRAYNYLAFRERAQSFEAMGGIRGSQRSFIREPGGEITRIKAIAGGGRIYRLDNLRNWDMLADLPARDQRAVRAVLDDDFGDTESLQARDRRLRALIPP